MRPLIDKSVMNFRQTITKRCIAIADTNGMHEAIEKLSGDWLFHAGKSRHAEGCVMV